MKNGKMLIALLVGLAAAWMLVRLQSANTNAAQCNSKPEPVRENFVPSNSREVGKGLATVVQMDSLAIQKTFQDIVDQDRGMFDVTKLPPMRHQAHTREQALQFIEDVLTRVNRRGDRRFHVLDVQSIRRESSFDPSDRGIIDRYTVNLFVQEKDERKVHAAAYDISMTFLVKPNQGKMQVTDLHFITDHFYKEPLVGGMNEFDNFFRIKNPFGLQQPFFTSEDKVLPDDADQIGLLKDHHKDMRAPRYRCFGSIEDNVSNHDKCKATGGYWDKPVQRSEECPFYQGNKNFVNRLGGVHPDGQFCEMPVGTKRIGYRYISPDPAHKPWCYNCRIGADGNPGSAGPCCDEQLNKQLYPNLAGPDYMFPGDALERGQHWQELGERGLHWRQHPTNIRDVTNPRQKQPVFNAIIGPGPGKIDPESFPN